MYLIFERSYLWVQAKHQGSYWLFYPEVPFYNLLKWKEEEKVSSSAHRNSLIIWIPSVRVNNENTNVQKLQQIH